LKVTVEVSPPGAFTELLLIAGDPKSVVNAHAPGAAKITVSNGKAKVEVPVVVSAPK
jgi:hypothetical protein